MTIDRISPPGAWQREWDARSHTETEYRQEIREMRERIQWYLGQIQSLEEEVAELKRIAESQFVKEP
jgi:predicted RNase H-like nuclease (RuvC/YqgF family)